MGHNGQSNDIPEQACTLHLDEALAELYELGFGGIRFPDGKRLPTFRSAIEHVLRLDRGNGDDNLYELEQLRDLLMPLVRCKVSTSLGNADVWRGAYAGNAILQS
ncbi:hypothetical protein KKC44_05445 [Patescibacteria group bacterium]|nr:hypothetical protein [Patescibacteria group bacterium]MBU2260018.1 hypothetical protein [Patescibacteria group bacterium]